MLVENLEVVHATPDALLVEFLVDEDPELDYNQFWIPASNITDGDEVVADYFAWQVDDDDETQHFVLDLDVRSWWIDKKKGFREAIERAEAYEPPID